MTSGYSGDLFYAGGGAGTGAGRPSSLAGMAGFRQQQQQQQQQQGMLISPIDQIAQRRADLLMGKRSFGDFYQQQILLQQPQQQQQQQNTLLYLQKQQQSQQQQQQQQSHQQLSFLQQQYLMRSVKQRTNAFVSSPISPLSQTIDLCSPTSNNNSLSSSSTRFGVPIYQQLRQQQQLQQQHQQQQAISVLNNNNNNHQFLHHNQFNNPTNNCLIPTLSNNTNNNLISPIQSPNMGYSKYGPNSVKPKPEPQPENFSGSGFSNLGQNPNLVEPKIEADSEDHKILNTLQELEKQLLDDDDNDDENDAVSVITNSEWSETFQNLVSPSGNPNPSPSPSPSPSPNTNHASSSTSGSSNTNNTNTIASNNNNMISPSPTSSTSSCCSTSASKSASTPFYLYSICSNATEFATNSDYHTNLNTLFKSLSSNAITNPTGFDITSVGTNTSDAIYGLFLCRGDQNITGCSDCVKTATTTDLPKTYCPNRKVALIWYDECMVRYSNEILLGKMDQSPTFNLVNTQNMPGNQTLFSDILGNTMNSLATQISNSKSSDKKYATTTVKLSSLNTLYAMEQCTPDLSATDCYQCLMIAIGKLYVRMGARVVQPSCFVHYETYPFYTGATNFSSPPPPLPSPSPGKATKITIVNNCTYTVWPGISIISSNVKVPTGFSLLKGESKIINIQSNWAGSIWGRTLCSLDHNGNFSCETGDCGTGKIECQGRSSPNLVTVADFRIGQIENQYMYYISVEAGYNLPMMVIPEGVTGARCVVTGCVFNLDNSICPRSLSVVNGNLSMIGCRNPCYEAKQCCKTWPLCLSSDYVESSNLFGKSCPRANNNPSDLTDTMFTCLSYKTSYKVTFCPSPNMASLFSTPLQTVQEFMPPLSSSAPPFTSSPSGKKKTFVTKVVVAIVVPIVVLTLLIASCTYYVIRKAKKSLSIDIQNVLEDFTTAESLIFEFSTLQAATNYFSDDQMLGSGGFGNVYKGTLSNGQDIAVKRLSRVSNQGMELFKNEAVLIAKLQHKNLVKLLGFCLTREEKLLVYEYVPNKSLNYFLFDPKKQGELDWPTRYNIITGIARGILYLHEDSRPRIVHRDLKAANILLEEDMNPKIADFGLARIFKVEQTEDDTNIVAGTYGYMAPEYAMNGQFSVKSDVYSFGVLVLEIVSGKKINSKSHPSGVGDLLTHAWRSLKEETTLNFMDPTLKDTYSADEVMRSIHLGLLCVQENAHERPTMSTIVFMLNTNSTTSTLPTPQRPRFYYNSSTEPSYIMTRSNKNSTATSSTSCDSKPSTQNQVTISEMSPR